VNKDTQTSGGTKGFSLRPGAVSRYYFTAEHRAAAVGQLRETIHSGNKICVKHPDLEASQIKKDESAVLAIVDLLENDWTNPFDQDSSDLVSISTGTTPSLQACEDLLSAEKKGEELYKMFQTQRL